MYFLLPSIAAKISEAQFNASRLATVYGFTYLQGFLTAVYDKRQDSADIYSKWMSQVEKELDTTLRSEYFTNILSDYVDSMTDLRRLFREAGYPVDYLDSIFDAFVHHMMVFANLSGRFELTPSNVVFTIDKAQLLHYDVVGERKGPPILVIYAPINRYHILDIAPEKSVVKKLVTGGLNTYLLDWGHPGPEDDNLSLKDYVSYVEAAIDFIKKDSNEDKVSILGYCWGGIMGLIYSSLHAENVSRLGLMAVPVDADRDSSILSVWAKALDPDKIASEFGHMDGQMLDLGFIMRNPPRFAFDKYVKFYEKMHDKSFVDTFTAVERWLYNTPPIPGNLYKDIINGCYKENALFRNQMEIDKKKVDLAKVVMPVLAITAEHDDLTSPASTLAVFDVISSKNKESMNVTSGHVGLCIGSNAHKNLWPHVAEWFAKDERSEP